MGRALPGYPSDRRPMRIARKYGFHRHLSDQELDAWVGANPLVVTPREMHVLRKYLAAIHRWSHFTREMRRAERLCIAGRPVVSTRPTRRH